MITKSDDRARESDLLITSRVITDRIRRREVLLPINHKTKFQFPRKEVMKERENLHKKTEKGGANDLMIVIG